MTNCSVSLKNVALRFLYVCKYLEVLASAVRILKWKYLTHLFLYHYVIIK